MQSFEDLVQLLPRLQADGDSFPALTSQQVSLATSLANQTGSAFDLQFLTAIAQANLLALQQTQTEINSGTDTQLRAQASARLAELQQVLSLTLALQQSEFSSSGVLGFPIGTSTNGIGISGSSAVFGIGTSSNTFL
jgi:hypothetical protein